MGITLSKIKYICDCGKDYGNCGEEGVFLLWYNRSVDIGCVFWKSHPDSEMQYIGSFTDTQSNALVKLLSEDSEPGWTDEEKEQAKAARGW